MNNIEKIIKKTEKEYKRFWGEVSNARRQWHDLVDRVNVVVEEFHKNYEQKKSPYPFIMQESSNIVDLKFTAKGVEKQEVRTANFNTINVSLGNASIGISYEETKYDVVTGKKSGQKWETEVEHNASLTFSQMPNGSIALVFFPTKSKLSTSMLGLAENEFEPGKSIYYIKKVYKFPCDIKEPQIIDSFKFLIDFSMYTSPVYRCGIIKNVYYWCLFWIYRKRYMDLAKNLGGFIFLLGRLIAIKN
ncbi:hypothetical protein JWG44_01080 [Leptospira sp. 201903071]|uniref:hypothetical protein n=1 Tax=Leptospira ainazelensis TaxID=2810034 RepID=UPI001964D4B1|nr:hypothetical protein [Leptospira ainazelensis]MBM9498848.1 hypothetical protein [Leptospira ainazelensis]